VWLLTTAKTKPFNGSQAIPINIGVEQGGKVSPILFTLYVDEILKEMQKLGRHTVRPYGFCDDLGFTAATENILYKGMKRVKVLIDEHKLTISTKKTKVLALYPPQCKSNPRNRLRPGQKAVGFEVVDQLKYLGVILSKQRYSSKTKLHHLCGHQYKHWLASLKKRKRQLSRLMGSLRQKLGLSEMKVLLSSYLRSTCLYGLGPIFPNLTKNQQQGLLKALRLPLKSVLGLPPMANNNVVDLLNPLRPLNHQAFLRYQRINQILCEDFPQEMDDDSPNSSNHLTNRLVRRLRKHFGIHDEDPHCTDLTKAHDHSRRKLLRAVERTAHLASGQDLNYGDPTKARGTIKILAVNPRFFYSTNRSKQLLKETCECSRNLLEQHKPFGRSCHLLKDLLKALQQLTRRNQRPPQQPQTNAPTYQTLKALLSRTLREGQHTGALEGLIKDFKQRFLKW